MKEFAGVDHVVFGDINLQEAAVRDPKYGAGAGGWPTIRYFNTATGYDGAAYTQKTSKSMCDELGGDGQLLRDYINEKGVPPCKADTGAHCDARETAFLETWRARSGAEARAEQARLEKMLGGSVKPDLKKWIQQRAAILAQLIQGRPDEL